MLWLMLWIKNNYWLGVPLFQSPFGSGAAARKLEIQEWGLYQKHSSEEASQGSDSVWWDISAGQSAQSGMAQLHKQPLEYGVHGGLDHRVVCRINVLILELWLVNSLNEPETRRLINGINEKGGPIPVIRTESSKAIRPSQMLFETFRSLRW